MACIGLAAQLVEASAVKRSLLKRPRRHLHSDHPVDIGSKVASPLRCSTTSFQNGMAQQVGFRDEITEVCNSSYCTPPRVASFQRPCPSICNNGGTMKENGVECVCPEGFYGLFCETSELQLHDYRANLFMVWLDNMAILIMNCFSCRSALRAALAGSRRIHIYKDPVSRRGFEMCMGDKNRCTNH